MYECLSLQVLYVNAKRGAIQRFGSFVRTMIAKKHLARVSMNYLKDETDGFPDCFARVRIP